MAYERLYAAVHDSEIFSSHEHIGSLGSFGVEGNWWFRSDLYPSLKPNKTGLMELIFAPYFSGVIMGLGCQWPMHNPGDEDQVVQAIKQCGDHLLKCASTGVYEALNKALSDFYGTGIEDMLKDDRKIKEIHTLVNKRYASYFEFYREVMRVTKTQKVIKPVHPRYVVDMESGKGGEELSWVIPALRVDSLVGFYDDSLVLDFWGIEDPWGKKIDCIDTLDQAISWYFALVDRNRLRCIKQFQAYSRRLNIEKVSREQAGEALAQILAGRGPGALAKHKVAAASVQDYIMRRILEEANARGLVYQFHTGMTNLAQSNPSLLEEDIRRYPRVTFVLLHCYPFIREAAYFARCYPNVVVDTSWIALQSPSLMEKTFDEYIGMIPYERITMSIDATCLEDYYGGLMISKKGLYNVLIDRITKCYMSENTAVNTAESILSGNARRLYEADWRQK